MRHQPGRIPAMSDVAKLAGVSLQTVSRVINGHRSVSPATRMRVQSAMRELGYRPNRAARALASGRSDLIGVIAEPSTSFGPSSTLRALEDAAAASGMRLSVTSVPSMDRDTVDRAIEHHLEQRVRGIVVVALVVSISEAIHAFDPGVPVVIIGRDQGLGIANVGIDHEHGARLAVNLLLDAGHRTVWHVSGLRDAYDSEDRIVGWRDALLAADAEVPPVVAGDWSARGGYEAGLLLARMPEVTAIFASNDQSALGILRALHEHGRAVPTDVSVVGFDDIDEAAYYIPPLTTIRQDFALIGRRAMASLLALFDGEPPSHELLAPELVLRQSVAPPPGLDAATAEKVAQ